MYLGSTTAGRTSAATSCNGWRELGADTRMPRVNVNVHVNDVWALRVRQQLCR